MMKLLNATQLKEWDKYTCEAQHITSLQLMERAATACAASVKKRMNDDSVYHEVIVFCGTGNNGGDGLAIARILSGYGFDVKVHVASLGRISPDFEANMHRLTHETLIPVQELLPGTELPSINATALVLDCIFGTGLNRPAEGWIKKIIDHINRSKAFIMAIDIPSGLPAAFTESSDLSSFPVIRAKLTLTFQQPKFSFLFSESNGFTGEFEVIDIGLSSAYAEETACEFFLNTRAHAAALFKPRVKFSHKGTYGHALIVAGSYGKMGAAVLASKAAMQTGCGLLTAYIPEAGYVIMQTALPEAMVITDAETKYITKLPDPEKYAAIGIGPGMGTEDVTGNALMAWLEVNTRPLVLDADALNIIAARMATGGRNIIPRGAILTPHPKEFDRLAGESASSFGRFIKQRQLAKTHQCIVVLKGAFTSIALPDGRVFFNSTGNPLLATAGSGDVLTGIITSFLAQGYQAADAAILGVYVHGICADRRSDKGHATMMASAIIEELPTALYALMNARNSTE